MCKASKIHKKDLSDKCALCAPIIRTVHSSALHCAAVFYSNTVDYKMSTLLKCMQLTIDEEFVFRSRFREGLWILNM